MGIPYNITLREDDLSFWNETGETTASGYIEDKAKALVRYLVSWTGDVPTDSLIFDLIFMPFTKRTARSCTEAVSLVYAATGLRFFINPADRPFSQYEARYSKLLQPSLNSDREDTWLDDSEYDDDLITNSLRTVSFILEHDTRLLNCFEKTA